MQKIIVANWKMNGSIDLLNQYSESFNDADNIIICPPFPYLSVKSKIILGAQNIFQQQKGAYTGEISARMLKELGVKFCLVGHSERRQYFFETNDLVRAKAQACIASLITPIICIGETLEQYEAKQTHNVIDQQLEECLPSEGDFWLAYEPVWAIGTGKIPDIKEIIFVHAKLREKLPDTKLLYGGSVTPENAQSILAQANIDGVLVGGASLDIEKIKEIYTLS